MNNATNLKIYTLLNAGNFRSWRIIQRFLFCELVGI